jgi:hypothetical protein
VKLFLDLNRRGGIEQICAPPTTAAHLIGLGLVGLLLVLIPLLVGSGLRLVRGPLLVVQCLPSFTQNLADLAEGDAWVLIADVLALLVGEKHVRGKTTLGSIGILLALSLLDLASFTALGSFFRHDEGFVLVQD